MKLLKNIKITFISVLFMGFVSTLCSSLWLLLIRQTVKNKSLIGFSGSFGAGLKEIIFCSVLHLVLALIVYINERTKS